ncbi:MAG: uroporphyrinogen decarboxylase [Stomatobaculum sp.]|nr:uroporphyrinogen decarboxylase [Stomatobaculum sp.]
MTKRERIRAAVNGQRPDKLPYAFWTHLPGIDLDPEKLADETVRFFRKYDLDFIKTMNNGMYAIEDFGCVIDYSQIPLGGVARVTKTPIHSVEDWRNLQPCSVEKGSLARELRGLDLVLRQVRDDDVPVIFTVFSPVTIANKLSGNTIRSYLDAGQKDALHSALDVITETTCKVAAAAIEHGADGVFFASQSSTYSFMNTEEYQEFGVPYDCRVLKAASGGWMNTIHAHGTDIMFDLLKDYPVHCFNWHAWESLPSVDEAALLSGKCLMGGLNRMDITSCRHNEIRNQIFKCLRITDGRNLILTPGCVIRYPLDEEMLRFIRNTKDQVEGKIRY